MGLHNADEPLMSVMEVRVHEKRNMTHSQRDIEHLGIILRFLHLFWHELGIRKREMFCFVLRYYVLVLSGNVSA